MIELPQYRLALTCALEQEQVTPGESGGPIVSTKDQLLTTKECFKISSVTPHFDYLPPAHWSGIYVVTMFAIFAMIQWGLAFLQLNIWFFESFSLFGTLLLLGSWLFSFMIFRRWDGYNTINGIEVLLDNGKSYRLTEGLFLSGIFGVNIS